MISFSTVDALLVVGGVLVYLLCQAAHSAAAAHLAALLGDETARESGRASLLPSVHIDPLRTLLLPVLLAITTGLAFGCGKPIPLRPERLRRPGRDIILICLAGPAVNLALAILLGMAVLVLARFHFLGQGNLGYLFLMQAIWINGLLCVVNLIPLPPLDASRVLAFFLPPESRAGYEGIGIYGLLFLVAAFFSPLGELFFREAQSLPVWFEFVAQLVIP